MLLHRRRYHKAIPAQRYRVSREAVASSSDDHFIRRCHSQLVAAIPQGSTERSAASASPRSLHRAPASSKPRCGSLRRWGRTGGLCLPAFTRPYRRATGPRRLDVRALLARPLCGVPDGGSAAPLGSSAGADSGVWSRRTNRRPQSLTTVGSQGDWEREAMTPACVYMIKGNNCVKVGRSVETKAEAIYLV